MIGTAGRQAEELARLLEGGTPVDDPTLGPLTTLASALRSAGREADVEPRPEFAVSLRTRLVAVATVQGIGATATVPPTTRRESLRSWRVQRRAGALAGSTALVLAMSGVGIAASRSQPGDPFYALKQGVEHVQLATASGAQAKGDKHLEFARTRLSEVSALVAGGTHDSATLRDTLDAMDSQTRAGTADLLAAFRQNGSPSVARALDAFAHEQYSELAALVPQLTGQSRDRAVASLLLLRDVEYTALSLRGVGGPAATPTTTTAPSGSHPTATPQATTAPPSARPSSTPTGGTTPSPQTVPGASSSPSSTVPHTGGGLSIPPLPTSLPVLPSLGTTGQGIVPLPPLTSLLP